MDGKIALLLSLAAGSAFAWTHNPFQCLGLLVFPLVCIQPARQSATLLLVFFASASAPIIWVAHSYTGNTIYGVVWYALITIINCSIFTALMKIRRLPNFFAMPIGIVVVSLSPIAYTNPVSLLPLAGWIFPSLGYLGIALFLVTVGLSTIARKWGIGSLLVITTLSFPVGHLYASDGIANISVVNVKRPYDDQIMKPAFRIAYRHEEYDLAINTMSGTVIFPESIYGVWDQVDGSILSGTNINIYGGARQYINGEQYRNVVVSGISGATVYEQRIPPFLPGADNNAVKGSGSIVDVGISFLICYEVTIPMLAIRSFQEDDPVVLISNLSWFKSRYLENRMRSLITAWSRLFNSPFLYSVMRHD